MSLSIGIVGLPQSGKTTVFNALAGGKTAGSQSSLQISTTRVPEPRLETLAGILNPKKVVPAEVRFIDIAAPMNNIRGPLLNQLSQVDALINVVRAFGDASVPHIEGSINPERDIAAANLELAFSDIAILERRLERIEVSMKGAQQLERQNLIQEKELLLRIRGNLEKELTLREQALTPAEHKIIKDYQFLTAKPMLIVVNLGEEQIEQAEALEAELSTRCTSANVRLITLCGKLEMELAQLDEAAAGAMRREFGLRPDAAARAVITSYELLGLISFFTIASGEVRAWSIPNGTTALKAAGKIHSDMERGFIRAEVTGYDDLVRCGSITEARRQGLLRLEGKNSPVADGDVITFLFNV